MTPTQYYCREKTGTIKGANIYLHFIRDSQLTQGWCMQEIWQKVHSMVKPRTINTADHNIHSLHIELRGLFVQKP